MIADASSAQASAHTMAGRWVRRVQSMMASWPVLAPRAGCGAGGLDEPHAGAGWSALGLQPVTRRDRPARRVARRPGVDRPAGLCAGAAIAVVDSVLRGLGWTR